MAPADPQSNGKPDTMRILYHFRTRGKGAEGVHIAGLVRALETLGHRVDLSSPTGVDPRQTAGVSPFAKPGKSGLWAHVAQSSPRIIFEFLEIAYNLAALFRNRRMLGAASYDFIYERHAFFLCSTAWLARRRGIPLVLEVNELVGDARVRAQPFLSRFAGWCDRFAFRRAALVVVVSPHLKRRIIAMGIHEDKVLVLPNAVDEEGYRECAEGGSLRASLHLADTVVIGFVGWLVAWHRLDGLLDVLAAICRELEEDVRLLLVGDGPLRESLRERATDTDTLSRILFVGAVSHEEIPAYVAAMDIAVIPHSNEFRSPIKLFEYMGQARAVVAPRTEPIEMAMTHEQNGLLFETSDAASLKAALKRLIVDPELRNRLGVRAREQILANHTWKHNAERVLECLRHRGFAVGSLAQSGGRREGKSGETPTSAKRP